MAERIAIALVKRADCYLVGPRASDGPLAGCWEFPGGKCRPGETVFQAAVRECREETGLNVSAQSLRMRVHHGYEFGSVDLYFVQCALNEPVAQGEPQPPFRWISAGQLRHYRFPPANEAVVRSLMEEAGNDCRG